MSGLLGSSLPARVGHVDLVQAELLRVAHGPLEVVQERPGVVASYADPVIHDGLQHLVDVMFVVVNSTIKRINSKPIQFPYAASLNVVKYVVEVLNCHFQR